MFDWNKKFCLKKGEEVNPTILQEGMQLDSSNCAGGSLVNYTTFIQLQNVKVSSI